jgi:hypothetical protein
MAGSGLAAPPVAESTTTPTSMPADRSAAVSEQSPFDTTAVASPISPTMRRAGVASR